MMSYPEPVKGARLSEEEVEEASAWGFNCGPAAICAALRMRPAQLRPHLLDFEAKRYTNPSLMTAILGGLGIHWRLSYRGDDPTVRQLPSFGLARIQWGGPWTALGVPMRARYRKTHWIAVETVTDAIAVFDVNAVTRGVGGWIWHHVWRTQLVPWLLKAAEIKRADGRWWPTHCIEIEASGV